MKVCMLVTNSVSNDPRVRREAATLVKAGYQVTVIGLQVKEDQQEEWLDGYRVVRVPLPRSLRRSLVYHFLKRLNAVVLMWLKAAAPRPYTVLRAWYRSINPRKLAETSLTSPRLPMRSTIRSELLDVLHILRINLKMVREALRQRADVYHAHDLDTLLAGYVAGRLAGKKLVYDFHELYTEQFKEGVKTGAWRFYYSSLERILVKRTDLRLTVCESLADWATQRYGTDGVVVVRNVPVYQPLLSSPADLGRDPVILYHGGYFRDRGLEQLIESVQYLERGRIVFRGFGELEDHLRALVQEQGLEDRVSFAPPVPMPELVKTAAEADIGVIPYIPFCLNNRFCLPNKIFEYMMAGLAVAGSDLPELRKVILGHNLGGVFNPEDPRDIARALNELLEDRAHLEAMKRNALLAARTSYNWEVEAHKLMKGYQSITNDPQPDASPRAGKPVVMLVTNEGLTDPRVLRSVQAAQRAGFESRLVCRLPAGEEEAIDPPGVRVQRVSPLWGRQWLKRLLSRSQDESVAGPRYAKDEQGGFWLRPWELWVLGGITWFNLQAVRRLWRVPAALYHANDLDTLPAGVALSRWKRVPLLYDAHELFAAQFPVSSRQFSALLFGLERWLIRFAHKVVTVNDSIAETLAEWHRVPLPTVVMNCPFAVEPVQPKSGGLGKAREGKARVIYQGMYVRDRGLEELIRSAAWFDSAELYLRGYGELEPTLRALVNAEHLQNRVHFLPPVAADQLVESLAGFDVGLIAYRATSLNNRLCLPNKIFEYLQAGLALAVSAFPEMERVVKETGAGEVFNPEQPRDIARAVNAMTGDANRLEELKERARAAAQRYTWETQGEPRLMACYQELAGFSSGSREGDR